MSMTRTRAGVGLAGVDPQPRLGRVEGRGGDGRDGRARDLAGRGVDAAGHVGGDDRDAVELRQRVDRLGRRAARLAFEAGAEQRVDRDRRAVECAGRPRLRRLAGQALEVDLRVAGQLAAGRRAARRGRRARRRAAAARRRARRRRCCPCRRRRRRDRRARSRRRRGPGRRRRSSISSNAAMPCVLDRPAIGRRACAGRRAAAAASRAASSRPPPAPPRRRWCRCGSARC